jgi:hypothetical protein
LAILLNLEKSTTYEAPCYGVFSNLLSLHLSYFICVFVVLWALVLNRRPCFHRNELKQVSNPWHRSMWTWPYELSRNSF